MIGKKVKWLLTWYGSTGEPTMTGGTVIAEHGDWFVIKANRFHGNPFVIKRGSEFELA